jgi:hypothetical protein
VKRSLAALAVVAAAIGFTLWWFSDRQVLKRRTAALLDTVSVESGASRISRGLQAAGIDGFLAPNVTLEVRSEEASGTRSRDEIAAGFRYVAEQSDFTRFELERIESLEVAGEQSTVVATIKAEVSVERRARIDGRYRTEFDWRKLDGRWRIARVAMVPEP